MVQNKGKRTLITASAVLIVLLVIGVIAFVKASNQDKADPYVEQSTSGKDSDSTDDSATKDSKEETDTQNPESSTTTNNTSGDVAVDPASVATVGIAPMSLTVSYVKGVGSFEYEVLRTANGTRYVVFSSSDLVGTKCTNDIGTFASILASPDSNESTTLAKTTTVDGTTYGLSLESSTCTANAEKLQAYQKSFSDAFSLLKKLN